MLSRSKEKEEFRSPGGCGARRRKSRLRFPPGFFRLTPSLCYALPAALPRENGGAILGAGSRGAASSSERGGGGEEEVKRASTFSHRFASILSLCFFGGARQQDLSGTASEFPQESSRGGGFRPPEGQSRNAEARGGKAKSTSERPSPPPLPISVSTFALALALSFLEELL